MSNSDVFSLLQTIFGGVNTLAVIIGGVLAVLGYLKLMKNIDDNAKERQAAIDNTAKIAEANVKDVTHKFEIMSTQNKFALIGLLVVAGIMMGSWMYQVTQLRKEWQEIKKGR